MSSPPGLAWLTYTRDENERGWEHDRACHDIDPEIWFAPCSNSKARKLAVEICGRCPVTEQCLAHALTIGNVQGIWGGTTQAERRKLRGLA